MRLTWWQQLLLLLAAALIFSAIFAIGDLIIYGRVKW